MDPKKGHPFSVRPIMQTVTRKLWRFGKYLGVLFVLYVLAYAMLSLCGHYEVESEGGPGHWNEFSIWAPLGFYDHNHSPPGSAAAERGMIIGTWRRDVVLLFFPFWIADTHFVHKGKFLRFIHREPDVDGKEIWTTNYPPIQ
jgi:hypothetical protein